MTDGTHVSGSRGPHRVVLSAFGIHTGGGRVLLEALLEALGSDLRVAALDQRLQGGLPFSIESEVLYVPASISGRFRAAWRLAVRACPGDTLFCFNGLPLRARARDVRVVLYMQARHLLVPDHTVRYPWKTAMRVRLERLWLRLGMRACDEVWVQTSTMANLVVRLFPAAKVQVAPFVDDELGARLAVPLERRTVEAIGSAAATDVRFFYPAEAVAHKNHAVLLAAWELLAAEGYRPTLWITIGPSDFERLIAKTAGLRAGSHVVNLGPLSRAQVLERMEASTALVFPSSLESYGLPLLEARAAGLSILAAERDFVREVCEPAQTFDPGSARSIADAVLRFLGAVRPSRAGPLSARALTHMLLP